PAARRPPAAGHFPGARGDAAARSLSTAGCSPLPPSVAVRPGSARMRGGRGRRRNRSRRNYRIRQVARVGVRLPGATADATIRTPAMDRTRTSVVIIAAAVALAGDSRGVSAQRSRPHWPPHATVHVWIDQRGLPPGDETLVERAMRTWTKASEG